MRTREFETPPAVEGRLDAWLASRLEDCSRSRTTRLIRDGQVLLDGRPTRPGARLAAGMRVTVRLPTPELPRPPRPQPVDFKLVFEDEDILVVDKPAGLVVHPAPGHSDRTLVNGLLHYCPSGLGKTGDSERPGIVHRLDRDTSGLLVVAKNDAAMAALIDLFKRRQVCKEYLVFVHGVPNPPAGRVETAFGRKPADRKRMGVLAEGGKPAVSEYRVLEGMKSDTALLEVRILTGRTHQIRVHMAHLGHPVIGDRVYGRRKRDRLLPLAPPRQMLHAWKLSLPHPIFKTPLRFAAEPPEDMRALLDALRPEKRPNPLFPRIEETS